MTTCIALLRGVNVGGTGRLPMKEFAALLGDLGLARVRTYIQSGNAVFRAGEAELPTLASRIGERIEQGFGFRPRVLILELAEFEEALAKNPFPEAVGAPETLHLGFLQEEPKQPELERLEALRKAGERFRLLDSVFYLHAPEGVGRSRLAAASEGLLGVPMTDRNWRTACALRELAREAEG